jgi:hypothetical protein
MGESMGREMVVEDLPTLIQACPTSAAGEG